MKGTLTTLSAATLALGLIGGAFAAAGDAGQSTQNESQSQTQATQSSEASAPTPPADAFIQKQAIDQWRAPKLIGVAVYGPDDKKIGTIKDILIAHDGTARAVVIGVGGFLGMGTKDVAVPFGALQWKTESRTVPEAAAPPSSPTAQGGDATPLRQRTIDPAAKEASQGYPDKALLNMTVAQLKAAPGFNYAPDPMVEAESASDRMNPANDAKPVKP